MKLRIRLLTVVALTLAAGAAAAVEYHSGAVPSAFELTVIQNSDSSFEILGKAFDFDGVIAEIKRTGAKTVRYQGLNGTADAPCASTLGVESGSNVFLIGDDGKAKSLNWTASAKEAKQIAASCRKP